MKQLLSHWWWLFFLPIGVRAQAPVQVSSAATVEQKISVRGYAGRPYRVSMRARVDSTQSGGAKVNLVVFVLNRQHGLVDIHSLAGPPARAPQWQPYSFTNKLGAAADTLLLRLFCFMSGTFAFDDISVEVQQAGQWQPLALVNSAFQTPPTIADALPPGWRVDVPIVGFTWHWQTSAGNAYLEVRSRGIIAYGHHAPAGHYCTANGVRLYYETYGQGPPLLLLHGNGQSIQDVSNQIAAFSPTYRVIAVDTRDHGKSAATRGALTYDLLADDMSALLDSLHVPAAHIVGWSDGGNTGLSMALRHPTRVKSLVTMGANLVADTTAVEASMLRQVRQDYRLTSLLGLISRPYRQARRRTAMLLHYPNLRPAELATIHAPVLVLAGEKDIIKQAHTRLIGRSIPGAQVYLLPALTHDAPKENPQLFNETVLHFLQRLEP